jgi:DNA mismatch repair protein MutS
LQGGREGSLLSAVDRTVTAAGARLLERRLSAPSRDLSVIHQRLDSVRFLLEQSRLRHDLREALRRVPDMDRALSRLALDRGGPRDLAAMRAGLEQAEAMAGMLGDAPPLLAEAARALVGHAALVDLLDRALMAEPPLLTRDGGFIAPGFDPELDETRALRDEGRGVIGRMQAEYVQLSGVQGLKIKHNNVLGYFIEVTTTHEDRLRSMPDLFIHRQTTAGQVRFTTLALSEMETRILNAGAHALEIEKRHYSGLRQAVLDWAGPIGAAARGLAEVDLAAGFADLAAAEAWAEPVVDDSRAFSVQGGRHPVVERALARAGQPFVANDCALTEGETPAIWLLTGPNMAGKSTFLRQNALMAMLAQAGVRAGRQRPDRPGRPGVQPCGCQRRSGARSVDLHGRDGRDGGDPEPGDDRALVILDEIGRGTATWDGLSIAWATLEHLHERQPLPRAVRHPLPRDDGAGRQAAGGGERHRHGEGVGGRGHLPARGQEGRRRPQLWRAGRPAGGPAA